MSGESAAARSAAAARLAGDGQDGALAGIVERRVEPVRAVPDRGGDVGRVVAGPVAERLREAEEEVRQHHPGVAAGAENRGAGHGARGLRKRRVAERPEGVGDGAQGEAEVGAGVAVGDGKDVDPVDLVAAGGDPVGGGEDGAGQPRTVDVRDPDAHAGRVTPATTDTRTSARTSGCSRTRTGVLPEGLDRMIELDPPPVHRWPSAAQRVGDVLRRDGAEELALLARLAGRVSATAHRVAAIFSASHASPAACPGAARFGLRGDPLLVALARLVGQAVREQIIAGVPGLHPHQLARLAEGLHVLAQDHFDHGRLLRWPACEPTPEI